MFCYLYWQTLLPFWGIPHFLHLLNEESFLNQISRSLISLFVTGLTPLQLAVYKSGTGTRGRGHEDACVGTWDLGMRDEGLEDIKYGTRGRQKQGRRGRGR